MHFQSLLNGGGLGMGVSSMANCADKYKRVEGGITVCADGSSPLPLQLFTILPSSQRNRSGLMQLRPAMPLAKLQH